MGRTIPPDDRRKMISWRLFSANELAEIQRAYRVAKATWPTPPRSLAAFVRELSLKASRRLRSRAK